MGSKRNGCVLSVSKTSKLHRSIEKVFAFKMISLLFSERPKKRRKKMKEENQTSSMKNHNKTNKYILFSLHWSRSFCRYSCAILIMTRSNYNTVLHKSILTDFFLFFLVRFCPLAEWCWFVEPVADPMFIYWFMNYWNKVRWLKA